VRLDETGPLERDEPFMLRVAQESTAEAPEAEHIRVLHVAQMIAGGVASFFEEIAAYQTEAFGKDNVHFLVPGGSEAHLPNIDPTQIMTFAQTSRRPGALWDFGRVARDAIVRLQPDIVHLHSSFAGAVVRAFLPRTSGKPRVIYCPHGWAFSIETSGIRKVAYAAVERLLARRTDLILVNSASEYNLAVKYGLRPDQLRTVRNGIGWTPAPAAVRRTGQMQLAFIGRHDRQKGIDILYDAIDRFPLDGIHFHIVGESIVGRNGSPSAAARTNVTSYGWLSRADTLQLLSGMDGLVMPSRWDAAPIVAIEAMRAGVPVIGSNRGSLPEIVLNGVGGYIFDIDQPDALGELLQRLNVNELRRRRSAARCRWAEIYVAERMNQLTRAAYECVLSQHPASPEQAPAAPTKDRQPLAWQVS